MSARANRPPRPLQVAEDEPPDLELPKRKLVSRATRKAKGNTKESEGKPRKPKEPMVKETNIFHLLGPIYFTCEARTN